MNFGVDEVAVAGSFVLLRFSLLDKNRTRAERFRKIIAVYVLGTNIGIYYAKSFTNVLLLHILKYGQHNNIGYSQHINFSFL